ncbi:MAG: acetyl-CoA carboxylase biotin carboxyl carrier protein [Trueperaceae bacterium]|nr:acetyl-CoA carboxylase biotin carboxyl carrier protein [Trueperaceae bacterium]
MDVKEVKKLLDAAAAADVNELTYETGDVRITVKRGAQPTEESPVGPVVPAPQAASVPDAATTVAAPAGAPAAVPPAEETPPPAAGAHLVEVTAPIVGTFYDSPAPDADAYVKVGDRVKAGAVLCIIEAMKLMNEIEAETAGTVAEILVRDEEPVEYGQVLFRIDPD